MAYPTGTDLQNYLISAGVITAETDVSGMDLSGNMDATIEEFETRTGYIPFLADSGTAVRRVREETPTRLWDPGSGMIPGTISVVHTPLHASPDDSANNETLESETEWTPVPYDPGPRRRPVNYIKLVRGARSGVLSITARWGYWTDLPDDVRQALLQGAACLVYDPLRNKSLTGESEEEEDGGLGNLPVEEIERGPLRVKLATTKEERRALFTGWENFYKRITLKYRRDTIS